MNAEHGISPIQAASEVYAEATVMRELIASKIDASSSSIFQGEMRPLSSAYAEQVERMIAGCKFATIRLDDVEYRENGTVWGRMTGVSP